MRSKLKLRLYKTRINQGGYDETGMYWGVGAPLYFVEADIDTDEVFPRLPTRPFAVRAWSREQAKHIVRKSFPSATFYR